VLTRARELFGQVSEASERIPAEFELGMLLVWLADETESASELLAEVATSKSIGTYWLSELAKRLLRELGK
jgi:hypothetical protein